MRNFIKIAHNFPMLDYNTLFDETAPFSLDGKKDSVYDSDGATVTVRKDGRYVTTSIKRRGDGFPRVVEECFLDTVRRSGYKRGAVLVVGLGNAGLVADSLGVCTTARLAPVLTDKKNFKEKPPLFTFNPSVSGLTGVDSSIIVKSVVGEIRPSLVVLADSLATSDPDKLDTVVQMKNDGMSPGGGVGADSEKLDRRALGVPVVSIGAPLVIRASALSVKSDRVSSLVLASKDVDSAIERLSAIISDAIAAIFRI